MTDCEELIDECLEGVERTISIVKDIREFSHAGGGAFAPADVNLLVEKALRMASGQRSNRLRVVQHLGPLPRLRCSAGSLEQVFLNLLVNAFDAVGREGDIEVVTRCEGAFISVRIIDGGVGIPAEDLGRLFDPFFTTKEAGQGTGLGLFVSYEIVKLHGGEIVATSVLGEGSSFEVRLPLATAGEDPA